MADSKQAGRRRFGGRTVLVTGGAAGIGAAHVRGFAAVGARVVFGDIDEEAGAALAAELGGKVRFVPHDVADEVVWERIVAAAEEAFGPVSVLVNNAAILPP
ncbi:MAG: 3alpha(or 20beta)-hydroxysteroid dehydrogenase, partial [Solirubrobacterales bacterium]|nr:3alpha(or 20beta)-hydroxysteroid dehydrogenase [Solirubrobacterales bacterium]